MPENLSSNTPKQSVAPEVHVQLANVKLWSTLNDNQHEMLISQPGRRMFPTIVVNAVGLNKTGDYAFYLDFVAVGHHPYHYVSNKWQPVGAEQSSSFVQEESTSNMMGVKDDSLSDCANDQQSMMGAISPASRSNSGESVSTYKHPLSGCRSAEKWMASHIQFDIKLTTKPSTLPEYVHLEPRRCYMIRVRVTQKNFQHFEDEVYCNTFPITKFITSSSYKSITMRKMKIAANPYAMRSIKGKRHHGCLDPHSSEAVYLVAEMQAQMDTQIEKSKRHNTAGRVTTIPSPVRFSTYLPNETNSGEDARSKTTKMESTMSQAQMPDSSMKSSGSRSLSGSPVNDQNGFCPIREADIALFDRQSREDMECQHQEVFLRLRSNLDAVVGRVLIHSTAMHTLPLPFQQRLQPPPQLSPRMPF